MISISDFKNFNQAFKTELNELDYQFVTEKQRMI